MRPETKKAIAELLLVVFALPTGLCSLVFTPMAFDRFVASDPYAQAFDELALICSGIGWLICALTIWLALRLRRSARIDPQALP